jgi:cAMP-dependent protein kinase regulator
MSVLWCCECGCDESPHVHSELALITNKPRAASVYAVGPVTCAALDVGAFERLLGPCMEVMKRNFEHYEEQLMRLFGTTLDITDTR